MTAPFGEESPDCIEQGLERKFRLVTAGGFLGKLKKHGR